MLFFNHYALGDMFKLWIGNVVKLLFLAVGVLTPTEAVATMIGKHLDWTYADTVFVEPYIDVDEVRELPVSHRYIHGGFIDGTRFSMYLPLEAEDYDGRFFQYVSPFPDSETSAQNGMNGDSLSMIGFAVKNGAYFLETNSGGQVDFTFGGKARPSDIGAYRANAACAELSRVIANEIFGPHRPYGYVFGGSGGAYRTIGCIENTSGVWDGAVPFVMGSPMAIPNVFAVRMNCMRVLRDKFPRIVDAMDAGGSGNPYEGLSQEEYQALKEATRMGFPLQAWYAWDKMGVHGFRVLYRSMVAMDPTYFNHDFWNEEGYLGANPTASLMRDRVCSPTVITRSVGYEEASRLGVAEPIDSANQGSVDKAWAVMGTSTEKPAAFELGITAPDGAFIGGDMTVLTGKAKGEYVQLMEIKGNIAGLAPTNTDRVLALIEPGDSVLVDNSNFLACQTYYRHQVPSRDYYVWDQFRDVDGNPIYPQRSINMGPRFAMGAAGSIPSGRINDSKVIVIESMMDSEAFPWQADWYRNRVKDYLGDKADDNFRLWYLDHGVHGYVMDATRTLNYTQMINQALLDLSQWCEKGIAPAPTSSYSIEDYGQVVLAPTADERKGIQPVVEAMVGDGAKRIETPAGEPVEITVIATVPEGYGSIVKAVWADGKILKPDLMDAAELFTIEQDMCSAQRSESGSQIKFTQQFIYDSPGVYFPTVKVSSQREGKADVYTLIDNLDRVRIVVK